MTARPLIVGNWKMNGTRAMLAEARAIDRAAARWPGVEVALAPPFPLIHAMAEALTNTAIGAQDCHPAPGGAHTGDVSAPMIADSGASFVILGHSERRAAPGAGGGHGESDALVRAKAEAAEAAELSVILCVGESEAERDAGHAEAMVASQLAGSLPRGAGASERLAIAYEPIWAIGTGRVPAVSDVAAMHRAIRAALITTYGETGKAVRILYGGSVNPDNAADLLGAGEVGGALVGGASLVAENFAAIINAAALIAEKR